MAIFEVLRQFYNNEVFNSRSRPELQECVECYWMVIGNECEWQKITPDGYTEIIFHFGDLYNVKSSLLGERTQPRLILAGQIDRPLYLKASGLSDIVGIKFTTTGLWKLFGIPLENFTNQTADLSVVLPSFQICFDELVTVAATERILCIENFLRCYSEDAKVSALDPIVETIKGENGQRSISDVTKAHNIGSRKLERLFLDQVGVSAQFAGESPEVYFKGNHAFANFFLNR